ncbi:copper homeostasis protein CutC [Pararhizobium sp.]|uniref:copper homeostasis protein CutC n=1 Tax=Pararhizobium sp. TaxID=1977563 RepID=UPI003FA7DBD8
MLLEVCIDDAFGLRSAIEGGADRIELCSALGTGGLTPSAGMMALAAEQSVPSYVMIRPRPGNFVYSGADIDVMLRDIDGVRAAGLAGVVLGANRPDGALDVALLQRLVSHSQGLGMTLHRAIDLVEDFDEAVEAGITLGFERILTSGGARTALEGIEVIRRAVETAAGRISILPGSGISAETVGPLLDIAGIVEFHGSCSVAVEGTPGRAREFGFSTAVEKRTSLDKVRALKTRISG